MTTLNNEITTIYLSDEVFTFMVHSQLTIKNVDFTSKIIDIDSLYY